MDIVREPPGLHAYMVRGEHGGTHAVPAQNIHDALGIDGVLRIQADEFQHVPDSGLLTCFNLESTGHVVGCRYALVPIATPGWYRSPENHAEPILDFADVVIGVCQDVRNHIAYHEVTDMDLRWSMRHIATVSDLESAIQRRYGRSMPDLRPSDIRRLGVGLTTLNMAHRLRYTLRRCA